MLLRFFSGDRPSNAFWAGFLALLLWIPSFLSDYTFAFEYPEKPMVLYGLIQSIFSHHPRISKIFAFLFTLLLAYMIDRINSRYILIQQRTLLPSFFFLMITSFFQITHHFSAFLFASFFFLIAIELIFSVYKAEPDSYRFFDAGLLIGLAGIICLRFIYLIVFIWIVGIILRPFYWREYIFPLLGMFLPFAITGGIHYFVHGDLNLFIDVLKQNFLIHQLTFQGTYINLAFAGFMVFLIFIVSVYMLKVFQFRKIYIRNYYLALFWLFIVSLVIFVFLSGYGSRMIYVLAIPVSFILSNYFMNSRSRRAKNILFTLFLLIIFGGTVLKILV